MNLAPGSTSSGDGQGWERRSARHEAKRRDRSRRLARAIIPALVVIVVVVAVAILSSPLFSAWDTGGVVQGTEATSTGGTVATTIVVGPSTAAPGATAGTAPPTVTPGTTLGSAPGSGLLVVMQNGQPAFVALFYPGPKGGVVLGMPGVTLLRSGDRFIQVAETYSDADPVPLAQAVAGAFDLPGGAVASADWSHLRTLLATASSEGSLPVTLDAQGADAGALAAALAATLGGDAAKAGVAEAWWQEAALGGQADAFRAAVTAAVARTGSHGWTGQVLTGRLIAYGDGLSYLEPDIQAARNVLTGNGTGPGATGQG